MTILLGQLKHKHLENLPSLGIGKCGILCLFKMPMTVNFQIPVLIMQKYSFRFKMYERMCECGSMCGYVREIVRV